MRRLFLFLFLMSTLIGCQNINDNDKRNADWVWWVDAKTGKGVWMPVGDGRPEGKTGSYTLFYFNGHIAETGRLINSQHVDTTFFYDLNGRKQLYLLYKVANSGNTIQDTITYFYNNGPIKVFRTNGSISARGVVKNHSPGDKWTSYFKDGKIGLVRDLKHDTGWIVNYYDTGTVKDSDYVEGKHTYPLKYFYPLGQIEKSWEFKNHNYNGMFRKYYLNGRLEAANPVVNGEISGRQVLWFEDGHLEEIHYMKNSLKNGPDTVYYESGKVKIIAYSIDDKLNGEYRKFDENGKLIIDLMAQDDRPVENKLLKQKSNSQQGEKDK